MGKQGALAMAMLLGDRDGLAEDENAAFQRAGVAHLMSVSGLHGLKERYGDEFRKLFRSITFDNGPEFSSAATLSGDDLKIYYAHPYTSWERPVNENWNGIVRRFLPKGKMLDALPDGLVPRIASMINSLPRKRFGYRCPFDLLNSYLSVV